MKTVFSRAVGVRAVLSILICAGYCWLVPGVLAQTNSWTNSASGNWQDSYWSLDVLPGTNQTILFTNAGLKVLSVGSNTAQNFPDTMSVDSVTVSAPDDSANVLLLDHAGFQTPFTANRFTIGSNSLALLYSSALQVKNYPTEIVGTFIQDGFSQASNVWLEVEGTYQLNSGILASSTETLWKGSAKFVQSGGSNYSSVDIFTNSEFDMVGGELTGQISLLDGAIFYQTGGHVSSPANFRIDGNFIQMGGIFEGPTNLPTALPTRIISDTGFAASILQTGGTNTEFGLVLGLPWLGPVGPDTGGGECYAIPPGSGCYTLSNAVLIDNGVTMVPRGSFRQLGGTHTINGDLNIHGMLSVFFEHFSTNERVDCEITSGYTLDEGGALSVRNIYLGPEAFFDQSDGTNEVSGSITVTNWVAQLGMVAHYSIFKGLLSVSSITLSNAAVAQYGGTIIMGDFRMSGQSSFVQTGGNIVQSGLLALRGTWESGPGDQQLGQLVPAINSLLLMPQDPCVLRFSDSSALAWSNNAVFFVQNWSGSPYGGGEQQIIFGTNAAALTPQQLSQIQFQNPAGLAPGNYAARILATGEIVPDTGAPLPPMINLLGGSGNGMMRLHVGGDIGQTYAIDVSTDLVHWNTWTDQFNGNGTMSFDDNDATNCPQRFYRARLMP